MAINKNALLRIEVLDKCLSNRLKKYYWEDLAEVCSEALSNHYMKDTSISRRQIYSDLAYMESVSGGSAPIERIKDGRRTYYRYEDKNFSIFKRPLTANVIKELENVIEVFQRVKGIIGHEWMGEIETKLEDLIDIDPNKKPIISFESNIYLKGTKYLQDLYNYIKESVELKIEYKGFKMKKSQEFIFQPYYLKQYNNRWFLFGHNKDYPDNLQNLALDRIISIENLENAFTQEEIDFEEYFEDIVGVTRNEEQKVKKILLSFTKERLPYVLSKPIHDSQRHLKNENHIELNLKINKEFISQLLSFGSDVEVIAPESLKKELNEEIEQMMKIYKK